MRVQCSTCLELLTPGDDLTCTPCGHVFHNHCVLQWFETKKNCPQCRHVAQERTLRRIFLAETDIPEEQRVDTDVLSNQLDSLKFQLRCKEGEKAKIAERLKELETQGAKQREEIKSLERAKQKYKEQGEGYRNQAKVLQEERFKYDEAKKKAEMLQNKLENYKGVELSLKGQEAELNNFLHERGAFDPRTKDLATLVVMLKQKLSDVKKERVKAETRVKEKDQEQGIQKRKVVALEVQVEDLIAINRSVEANLRLRDEEIVDLKKKLSRKPKSESSESSLNTSLAESPLKELPPSPAESQEPRPYKLPRMKTASQSSVKSSAPLDDTLPLATCGILGARKPLDQLQNLANRSKSNSLTQHYDGLGGRSKFDSFPQPKLCSSQPILAKKRKPSTMPVSQVHSKQMKTLDKFFGDFDTP